MLLKADCVMAVAVAQSSGKGMRCVTDIAAMASQGKRSSFGRVNE